MGSGSGYLTVCMASMVGEKGITVGVEHVEELVEKSKHNTERDGKGEMLQRGQLLFVMGDGRRGWREGGPYNAIHVGAAASEIPTDLVDQLAPGGRMVIPVGEESEDQSLQQVERKEDGRIVKKIYQDLKDLFGKLI